MSGIFKNFQDYLKAAAKWGVLPMFNLELSAGLRRGELVALLWSDLNLQTKTLTVSKSGLRRMGQTKKSQNSPSENVPKMQKNPAEIQ